MKKLIFVVFLLLCESVAAQPQLQGGLEAFIKAHLKYPPFSLQNCVEGTVTIAFQLDREGRLKSSSVHTGVGTDLDDEALRIIRKSTGKWKVPSSFDTSTLLLVPVNFKIEGKPCELKSKKEIRQAVAAYQAQEGLKGAILNFYKKRIPGKVYPEEATYVQLKKELGYDEAYMEEIIARGKAKLKEEDQQGACEDFLFVRNMGFTLADDLLEKYCQLPAQ